MEKLLNYSEKFIKIIDNTKTKRSSVEIKYDHKNLISNKR